jgi:hypothetical protein
MLKTGDTFERRGKTFEFKGIELINEEDFVCKVICDELVPEWITPTDEHAKQRPACEVRDYGDEEWRQGATLIRVRASDNVPKFLTDSDTHGFCTWKQCRIRNPEWRDLPTRITKWCAVYRVGNDPELFFDPPRETKQQAQFDLCTHTLQVGVIYIDAEVQQ